MLSDVGPVVVVTSARPLPEPLYRKSRDLVPSLLAALFVDVNGLCSQLAGPANIHIDGADGRPFHVSPSSFGQANPGINRIIAETTAAWIAQSDCRTALELFSGAGQGDSQSEQQQCGHETCDSVW